MTTPSDYLQAYLTWLATVRRYSPLTAENYARDVRRLLECLGAVRFGDV